MRILRRLYVYGIAAVALALAAVGAVNLVELVVDQVWVAFGGRSWIEGGDDWARRQLSLFLPFVVIATPIWMLHWWLAERSLRGPDREPERRSTVRATYLTAVLASSVPFFALGLLLVVRPLITSLLGSELPAHERADIPQGIGLLVVVTAIWLFHWRARERDYTAGPLTGPPLWLPRLYIYAVGAVGIVMTTIGVSNLLELAGEAITGQGSDIGGSVWWHDTLASGLQLTLTGTLLWLLHWGHSLQVVGRSDWRGASERSSRLRPMYLIASLLVVGLFALLALREGIDAGLRQALGVPYSGNLDEQILDIVGPPIIAIPYVLVLLYQRYHLFAEARRFVDAWQSTTATHLYGYGLGILGLAFAAVGAVDLLSIVIELGAIGADDLVRPDDWWRGQLSTALGMLTVGIALWLWHWLAAQHRRLLTPDMELQSTIRQAYIFLIFGASAIALLISSAITAYRLLERAFGVSQSGDLALDLSVPVATAFVAGLLAAYHGNLVRTEVALGALIERPEAEAPERMVLVLKGPPGSDLDTVANTLIEHVPDGFELHRSNDSR